MTHDLTIRELLHRDITFMNVSISRPHRKSSLPHDVRTNGVTVSEDFLTVLPLTGRTTRKDVYDVLMKVLTSENIDLSKLVSIVTDGASSMVGRNKGLIAYLKANDEISAFVHYYCLLHFEMLCSRLKGHTKLIVCLEELTKVINFLTSRILNIRFLKVFLDDLQASHSELIVHAEICWLIRGRALTRV
ncbi:protein FAM200C-like [Oratosquilla oratoria]|uniref:protein FAM200C-like n=1 Tax=Oratosquilla oratoria TaxID=337810 RepID=UPI003F76CD6F